jgi:NAD(P)-dependent dehydrogenase (short-subunit alcohol dehydrogenase family)
MASAVVVGSGPAAAEACAALRRAGYAVALLVAGADGQAGAAVADRVQPFMEDASELARALDDVAMALGPLRAAVSIGAPPLARSLLDVTHDAWDAALRGTATRAFLLARAAAGAWREPGDGVIVNVAFSDGAPTHACDRATAATVECFSRSLALDLAPRARVHTVLAPSTGAADLAAAIAYLTGERATYLTGSCLPVGRAHPPLAPAASAPAPRSPRPPNGVAVVTGAARGIGRAIALELAARGYAVACWGRTESSVDETRSLVARAGARATAAGVDVACPDEVDAVLRATAAELGPVGVVINNAGVFSVGGVPEMSPREWQHAFDVNLSGSLFTAQGVVRAAARAGRSATVVNVGSVTAVRPLRDRAHYCASKAGVHGLTVGLADELARLGMRAVAVAPKGVASGMSAGWLSAADGVTVLDSGGWQADPARAEYVMSTLPVGRTGSPEDVAGAVAYLVSAGDVSGAILPVDGGYLAGDPVTR